MKEQEMNRTAFLSLATILALAVAHRADAVPVTIYSDPNDAIVASVVVQGSSSSPVGTKLLENTTGALIIGNYGSDPARNGNAILFFELPSNVQSIDAATLSVRVDLANYGSPSTRNVDAWGLGYQSGTSVDINNWFNTSNTDAGAGVGIASRVKIQDNLLAGSSFTNSTTVISPPALRTTSGTALQDYLQSLYDAGAQGGDYAIIRLNLDYNPGTALSRYRILSGDNSDIGLRPVLQLEYTAVPIPAPEPSTGILIPGAIVLFGLKRRRNRR
jgi:hypothetical protein